MRAKIRIRLVMASLLCFAFAVVALPTYGFAQAVPDKPVDAASLKPQPALAQASSGPAVPSIALNPQTAGQDGAAQDVEAIAFSPNGMLLATEEANGTIKTWDLRSGKFVRSFSIAAERVSQLAFSPDSKLLAVTPEEGDVFLLDVSTGKQLHILGSSGSPSMAFSPDRTTLAIGDSEESITLWNYRTGKRLYSIRAHVGRIGMLQFSSDGSLLASIGDGIKFADITEIWSVRSGDLYRTVNMEGEPRFVTFSPDGHTVALAVIDYQRGTRSIELWDFKQGVLRNTLGGKGSAVLTLTYNHDGSTLLVTDAEGLIRAWNPRTGAALRTMGGSRERVAVAVSPDTRLAAVCPHGSAARIYNTVTGSLKYTMGQSSLVASRTRLDEPNLPQSKVEPPLTPQDPNARLHKALSTPTYGDPPRVAHIADELKQALASGADVNTRGAWGTSALMFFASSGDLTAVKDLVHQGAGLDFSEKSGGRTALLNAVSAKHPEIVQFLLDAGADLKDLHGKSLLPLRGHPDALGAVLAASLDRPAMFGTGRPSAEEEAQQAADKEWWSNFDSDDTVLLLLQFGALPNIPDKTGHTAIQYTESVAVVQALLAHGADINVSNNNSYPPLVWWAREGQIGLVRIALDHGANVNIATEDKTTALNYTAQNGHDDIARLLLERHADPNIALNDGRTPLMMATEEGNLEVVKLLLSHGAKLEAKADLDGWTALTYAVNREDREEVRLLLEKGADVHVLTKNGEGLLKFARDDSYGIAALLEKAGYAK